VRKTPSCRYSPISTLQSRHPDLKDLTNLAWERLSKKKTQRLLNHCKG